MRFSGQKCKIALQAGMSARYGIKIYIVARVCRSCCRYAPHDSFIDVNVEYLWPLSSLKSTLIKVKRHKCVTTMSRNILARAAYVC